jgi:hypothetical protein
MHAFFHLFRRLFHRGGMLLLAILLLVSQATACDLLGGLLGGRSRTVLETNGTLVGVPAQPMVAAVQPPQPAVIAVQPAPPQLRVEAPPAQSTQPFLTVEPRVALAPAAPPAYYLAPQPTYQLAYQYEPTVVFQPREFVTSGHYYYHQMQRTHGH